MTSNAPPIVWLDDRIAAQLPQAKDEELAERGGSQTRYISQTRVNALVDAARGPSEMIVQIQAVGQILYGLSNQGRLFAQGTVDGQVAGWHLLVDAQLLELEP